MNERAAERAARAEEAERVARAAEAEAEHAEKEREAEIEREVRAADALEREKVVRQHELKVLELTKKDRNSNQSLNGNCYAS